ncbi:hypothetical protein ACHAXA_006722 [Cyclostephanos tholiformis]|uniref:Uncharacterized protein n=1 Tax=Cyclostephanos tholiformis TaxID=382380 RepID=A0ABD3SSG4_9STRA
MMNDAAAEERQERIESFKKKIAGLHATSRKYNITSDCSINTLDSSFAAASVNSSSNATRASSYGSVDLFRDANKATFASANELLSNSEKRCPEETTNLPPLLDDEDVEGSENEREVIKLTLSDDEISESTDILLARDSESVEERNLFEGMMNAFRKSLHQEDIPGENPFASDDEDSVSTSQPFAVESKGFNPFASDDEDSVGTSQPLAEETESFEENNLLEEMLNTFRNQVMSSTKAKENVIVVDETRAKMTLPVMLEEEVSSTPHRPGIVTTRAVSQSSKVSAYTLATSGGFSIESVAASGISANTGTSGISADTSTSCGFSIQSIADGVNSGGSGVDLAELVASKMANEQLEKPISVTSTSTSASTSTYGELESVAKEDIQQGHGEVATSPVNNHVTKSTLTYPSDSNDEIAFVEYTEKIVSQRLRRLVDIGREIKDLQDTSDAGSTAENSSSSSTRGKRERRHGTIKTLSSGSLFGLSKHDEKQKVESSETSTGNDVWLATTASTMTKNQAPSNPFAELLKLRQSHKMAMKKFQDAESLVSSNTSETCSAEAVPTAATGQQSTPAPAPHMNEFVLASSSNTYVDTFKSRQNRKKAIKQMSTNSMEGISFDDSSNSNTSKSVNTVAEDASVASSAIENYIAETLSASQSPRDSLLDLESHMSNLFSDLLRLRQTRKATIDKILEKSVGGAALDDSSNADTSMSSKFTNTDMGKNNFSLVYCDDDNGKESLDGELFSNLKQALSKIQSIDSEDYTENSNGDDNDPHVIVKDMGSCAVSSLKDESYIMTSRKGNVQDVDDDDDLLIDEDYEVKSVPKSPASIEDWDKVHETETSKTRGNDDDNDTVARANSNKVDNLMEKDRNTTLTPPRKRVVLSDGSASISTKDSILGRSINISNDALVSERIYLESLRAQVHAELKVHVADEEIRLALAARLHAIQDFYKRKATVLSLGKSTSFPISPKSPLINNEEDDAIISRFGGVSRKVKTANSQDNTSATHDSLGRSDVNPAQRRQDTHMYALQRAQANMNEAIRAVHNSPRSSSYVPNDDDGGKAMEAREGEIPGHIFPNDTFWNDEDDPHSDDAGIFIESARTPARVEIAQNAWKYYLNINSLIFESRVYDYQYKHIQDDPLYPYLDSLVGIADSGEDGYADENKRVSQKVKAEYKDMSSHRICHSLAKDAEDALPGLRAICTDLGSKLGIQTMAVGPVKKPSEALLKCEKKYGGDPLLVTDYCRTSLFVKDIATLLALIEIVLSKYTSIVRRIKLSTLKSDHNPLLGGYRDCKINLDVGGHVCEIQVHLIAMWLVKEAGGYVHYKKCCEHNVYPSTFDIGRTLAGLSRDVLNDLVLISEADMKRTPVESLQHHQEEMIRDYFALANLYICHSRGKKAELILRRTAKLRSESEKFGRYHAETSLHLELLRRSLKLQHKYKSAAAVKRQIKKIRSMQGKGHTEEPTLSQLWAEDQCGAFERVCEMIIDPAKIERQNEEQRAFMVDESRAIWLRKRRDFFPASGQDTLGL